MAAGQRQPHIMQVIVSAGAAVDDGPLPPHSPTILSFSHPTGNLAGRAAARCQMLSQPQLSRTLSDSEPVFVLSIAPLLVAGQYFFQPAIFAWL